MKKLLVPVDLYAANGMTDSLCKSASDFAQKFGASVNLLSVMPDYGMPFVESFFPQNAQVTLKKEIHEKLIALSKKHFKETNVSLTLRQGKKVPEILREAEKYRPDLIIIGCRRKKSRNNQRLLGSSSLGVTNRATCSVLVVRFESD